MFSTLRTRFGIPGVISVIALVFAMFGGAYAANNASSGGKATASAKAKKGPRGPKGATGPAGAQGPTGPQGPAGAKGDAGANGANGAAGPTGPTGAAGAKGATGAAGQTGFTETLPSGKTETGTFAYATQVEAGTNAKIPISFSIPLASPLTEGHVHLISADGSKEIIENESTATPEEVTPTGCGSALTPPGTAAKPTAAPGNLCVYVTKAVPDMLGHSGSNYILDPSTTCEVFGCLPELGGPGAGAGVSGARIEVFSGEQFQGYGTWAVTAP
jgi:hypothetical protein